jgi:hypothetical protein
MRFATILILSAALWGCANPYSEFYKGNADARVMPMYDTTEVGLKIYSTSDVERDRRALMRKGFFPIGEASFNAASGNVTDAQLRQQAEKVGAHVVLVSSRYSHTVNSAVPMTVPTTTTSYSTGHATAYGPGGTVNAYGSGTTTTYGTQTTMVPIAIQRSDFGALFFAKQKQRFGALVLDLDDATRRRLGSNSGVLVDLVVDGSTAFRADILPGDIILSVAGEPAYGRDSYTDLLRKYGGRSVTFRINRDGALQEKELPIGVY